MPGKEIDFQEVVCIGRWEIWSEEGKIPVGEMIRFVGLIANKPLRKFLSENEESSCPICTHDQQRRGVMQGELIIL